MNLPATNRTFDTTRPLIMGIVNASPESFSDSKTERHASLNERVKQALTKENDGADIIDIGGQTLSSRVDEIGVEEELERVIPLITTLREHSNINISIETYRPQVVTEALKAGANIVNDAYGLHDPGIAEAAAARNAFLIIAHNLRQPKEKQEHYHEYYTSPKDLSESLTTFFANKIQVAETAGIPKSQLILDPGPDLTKTPGQTITMLQMLDSTLPENYPILLALSRKRFIGAITNTEPAQRGPGTLAAIGWCIERHPNTIVRVHDVAATRQYLDVLEALNGTRTLPWSVY